MAPARAAAFAALLEMERAADRSVPESVSESESRHRLQLHADELLRGARVDSLAAVDRNLATALVLGALRWQLALDAAIKPLLAKPNARLDAEIRVALRLGALQLLLLERIPVHAAIGESVELAKLAGHRFAAGMVNAVLRKLSQEKPAWLGDAASARTVAELAHVTAHPEWMVARWVERFGWDAAAAICRHGQEQAATCIRMPDREADAVALEMERDRVVAEPGDLLAAARVIRAGDVTGSQAFRQSRVRIQDEGSQLVAELAGVAPPGTDGGPIRIASSILDCCAAPGGKTLILMERNPAARIVACEIRPARLEALRRRMAAFRDLGSSSADRIEFRLADAANLSETEAYDLVLADVPCSGTGTLGRNPEIRHRLSLDDLEAQAERQRAILRAALLAVKQGGRVIYSTCSLEAEENEQVVAAILAEMPGFQVVSLAVPIDALAHEGRLAANAAERLKAALEPEGWLRLVPGKFSTDGFFVCALERVPDYLASATSDKAGMRGRMPSSS